MKICFCANSCWYLYNFRKNTIRHLVASGFEVVCIAPFDNYADKLVSLGCVLIPWNLDPKGINPLKELSALTKLFYLVKGINADIFLSFNPKLNIYGGLIFRFLKRKQIANISGLGVMNGKNFLVRMFYLILYRFSLKKAHHVFFQNERDKDLFASWNIVAPQRTSRLMGSGVDLVKFSYAPIPPAPPTKFVFIGRLIEEKGVRLFIKAFSKLKEKHGSVVAGSIVGILEKKDVRGAIKLKELEDWQDKLGVSFRGASDNIDKILPSEHFVVLPTFYAEGVPRTALEASAVGRGVITTRLPGCSDAVLDGITGYLCEPKSVTSLFEAMDAAVSSSESEKARMGNAARHRMEEHFNEEQNIMRYMEVIRSAMAKV